jgi:S-adenosylmethionine hydrolase
VRTFADAGRDELLLYEDAQRRLAIAVRHGDAAALLGLTIDAELRVQPG